MGISTKRSELQPCLHRGKRVRVHLDGIEKVLAALLPGKEIVDRCNQGISAEFPGVPRAFQADSFSDMKAMLAILTRQQICAPYAVENGGNLDQYIGAVAVGPLKVAGELRAEAAYEMWGNGVSERFAVTVLTVSSPLLLMELYVTGLAGSRKTLFDPQ